MFKSIKSKKGLSLEGNRRYCHTCIMFLTMLTIFNDYNDLYEISMIGACLDFKVNITGGGGVLL